MATADVTWAELAQSCEKSADAIERLNDQLVGESWWRVEGAVHVKNLRESASRMREIDEKGYYQPKLPGGGSLNEAGSR